MNNTIFKKSKSRDSLIARESIGSSNRKSNDLKTHLKHSMNRKAYSLNNMDSKQFKTHLVNYFTNIINSHEQLKGLYNFVYLYSFMLLKNSKNTVQTTNKRFIKACQRSSQLRYLDPIRNKPKTPLKVRHSLFGTKYNLFGTSSKISSKLSSSVSSQNSLKNTRRNEGNLFDFFDKDYISLKYPIENLVDFLTYFQFKSLDVLSLYQDHDPVGICATWACRILFYVILSREKRRKKLSSLNLYLLEKNLYTVDNFLDNLLNNYDDNNPIKNEDLTIDSFLGKQSYNNFYNLIIFYLAVHKLSKLYYNSLYDYSDKLYDIIGTNSLCQIHLSYLPEPPKSKGNRNRRSNGHSNSHLKICTNIKFINYKSNKSIVQKLDYYAFKPNKDIYNQIINLPKNQCMYISYNVTVLKWGELIKHSKNLKNSIDFIDNINALESKFLNPLNISSMKLSKYNKYKKYDITFKIKGNENISYMIILENLPSHLNNLEILTTYDIKDNFKNIVKNNKITSNISGHAFILVSCKYSNINDTYTIKYIDQNASTLKPINTLTMHRVIFYKFVYGISLISIPF
jgi:hypothetical protein